MTRALTASLLVCASLVQPAAAAAHGAHPNKTATAEIADGFVAAGWSLEHRLDTDLDADGLQDLVLIVRQDHDQSLADRSSFDVMRRSILIAFANKETGRYNLVQRETALIPVRESKNVEDYLSAYAPLEPKPKGFAINLERFMSAGGWETELRTFRFEYRDGRFSLVAFESQRTHRASGKTSGVSIDYTAGLAVKNSGNIQDDETTETLQKLTVSRLYRLEDVGPAFDFNPAPVKD
ncbi:MAG: hypothetical protein AAGA00_05200 [Pseudomonadota bacterium]